MRKKSCVLICLFFLPSILFAQKERVAGKIIDAETGGPVVGASITLSDQSIKGTSTDVDGGFFLLLEKNKTYTLNISSIGYRSKQLTDVTVENEGLQPLNISLQKNREQLELVIVKASARKEAQATLYTLQKIGSSISDGISAELISKSPDKNTGDVLKRVSGTSIQENKFVVIRGLSERYNVSLLNNALLPSTEADKKAFAFNIIPSSVVDNLVIYKSPTPDLPGDFSGGAIKIITKDYPTKKISELSVSTSYNSLTTGKNFYTGYPNGSLDNMGFFDGSRLIPGAYARNKNGFVSQSPAFKKEVTKLFPNTYGFAPANQSMPSLSISYTGGNTLLLKNSRKFGYIYSLGYSNGRAVIDKKRDDYDIQKYFLYGYHTSNYDEKNNLTAMLNLSYSFKKNKIAFKNLFNNNFVKSLGIRTGINYEIDPSSPFYIKSMFNEASGNGLLSSVLEGFHKVGNSWSLDWNLSYSITYRNQPDQKVLTFRSPENFDGDYYLKLSNENSPDIRNAGRVYSFLLENIYGASANASKEFKWWGKSQKLKFGTLDYYRQRSINVDALGYASLSFLGVTIPETKTSSWSNIFSTENIDRYNLTVANIETNSTDYHGSALMNAAYLMLDNKLSDKIKLTWGARMERYYQELSATGKTSKQYENIDILPSALLTYALNNKTNLRLSVSQAVNRPEFRELADYSVFDYDNYLVLRGNPNLKRCKNTNADFRYEWFPDAGEVLSGSLFYKYFDAPIEQTNMGNDVLSYQNAGYAYAYGAELEVRKKLDFFGADFFKHLIFYTNATYIKGGVHFGDQSSNSPMQGQSPYLINGGLNYISKDQGFSVNLLYNRIGPRLKYRAVDGAGLNIFESSRDMIDLQFSKKILKEDRLTIKLTISDLLAQPFSWYYKYEANPSNIHYQPFQDKMIYKGKYGTSVSLSLRYSFSN
ncbi:MAG: TonB-dependent receptor [Bacteroidetes bacterium]|nr:TonB-dependent receptor [Bacteroidota bacterium]